MAVHLEIDRSQALSAAVHTARRPLSYHEITQVFLRPPLLFRNI